MSEAVLEGACIISKIKEHYCLDNAITLFFMNGVLNSSFSDVLPQGVYFDSSLQKLEIEEQVTLEKPVHLIWFFNEKKECDKVASQHVMQRRYISICSNASANIIEYVVSSDIEANLTLLETEIYLADSARLSHAKVILEKNNFHEKVNINQLANSHYISTAFLLNPLNGHYDLSVGLKAENSRCDLFGFYFANQKNKVSQQIRITHNQPNALSKSYFKGVIDQQAVGEFQGLIFVEKEANGTDAALSNKNILLSDDAQVNTKPELEIYADDVKCSHGATVGCLDEVALDYMQSRGIDLHEAKQLLLMAFADDILSSISFLGLKQKLNQMLSRLF